LASRSSQRRGPLVLMGRRFEELGDVCDAHELRLELHAKPRADVGRQLVIQVSDGAGGKTRVPVDGGAGILDVAAGLVLKELRRVGVVP
jgi:hypothetical protein